MLIPEILWFGVSGVIGFAVDATVLSLLVKSLGPHEARWISFSSAVVVTWIFNRNLTFRHRRSKKSLALEFLTYLSSMLAGATLNLGLYTWLIESSQKAKEQPVLALALGSLAGMSVNFLLSRTLIFKSHNRQC